MTEQEWDVVEKELQSLFCTVKLSIDGYEIGLHLTMVSNWKNAIMVYVNGKFEGKWLIEDCEERKKFFAKSSYYIYNKKQRDAFQRISKKTKRTLTIDIYKKIYVYWPYWQNFAKMKAHFIKNNQSIERMAEV